MKDKIEYVWHRIAFLFGRQQLMCILAAMLLAAAAYLTDPAAGVLRDGHKLVRADYGEEPQTVRLKVEGLDGKKETIEVEVSPKSYSEEQLAQKCEELMEVLPDVIKGTNQDLSTVEEDLQLLRTVPGYEGIQLTWYPEDPELISYEGTVCNEALDAPKETELEVSLIAGELRQDYVLGVTVQPKKMTPALLQRQELLTQIAAEDIAQKESELLCLPEEINGAPVHYTAERGKTPLLLCLLGPLAAILLSLKPEEEKRQKKKEREQELLADYSELIAKLIVYLGAGLTIRNAWEQIVSVYAANLQRRGGKPRALYEEMYKTSLALYQGVSEDQAYIAFAHRCGLRCYLRFASLLEQNRKNGGAALRNMLMLEMQEAFEERKHAAKRLGEEAGTKLMAPLFLSLIAVLLIIIIPAMMSLG